MVRICKIQSLISSTDGLIGPLPVMGILLSLYFAYLLVQETEISRDDLRLLKTLV